MTRVEIHDRRTGDNVWGLWVLDLDAWIKHWNENCAVTLYEYRVKPRSAQ